MKSDDILDAIGMVDDACIKNAKTKQKSQKTMWITITSLAACLALLFLIPRAVNLGRHNVDEPVDYAEAVAVAEGDVWIYFVEGNEVLREQEFLPLTAEDIFAAWKEKNGIGNEVELIVCRIDSNATTSTFEFEGNEYIRHEIGDYFILNITVSTNLKSYFDTMDSELLLQSLEQTMTEYSNIEYNEYHITFE